MTDEPTTPSRAAVGRTGIVVVVLAVVVGLLLLGNAYGDSRSEIDAPHSASKQTMPSTTTTTLAGRPPAEVKVKVVNATSTNGLATRTRDLLQLRGYTQVAVGDTQKVQEKTTIFYLPGYEAEGQNVARALGLAPEVAQPMPVPPPVELGEAVVLVMAGLDI